MKRPPLPSLPEIDATLREYVRSSHPPTTSRALAEALLVENAMRREVRRDLRAYTTETGTHVVMTRDEAEARMVALRVEEDAERFRAMRGATWKIGQHLVTAVLVAFGAWLWTRLLR